MDNWLVVSPRLCTGLLFSLSSFEVPAEARSFAQCRWRQGVGGERKSSGEIDWVDL